MTLELNPESDSLMVIAPHCDDELLGCGGIIQRALQKGIPVKVVVVTNGDGFRWAAIRNFRRPFISHRRFRKFGELRQQESIAALERLGLARESIYFLGYPDRGLQHLWRDYWHHENHYFSRFTKAKTNPYQATYKPEREYTGQNLVADLKEILFKHQPTKMFVASTHDDHADHWAVYNFFHYALTKLKLGIAVDYQPKSYQYLVHRGKWPLPQEEEMALPGFLETTIDDWINYRLTTPEIKGKLAAIKEYESQIKVMRKYLLSFVKDNELFIADQERSLGKSARNKIEYREPTADTKQRRKLPGVDLQKLEFHRQAEELELTISTRGKFTARCRFRANLYLLTEQQGVLTRQITELAVTPGKKSAEQNLQLLSEEELTVEEINLVSEEGIITVLLAADVAKDSYLFFNVATYFKDKLVDRSAWRIIKLIN